MSRAPYLDRTNDRKLPDTYAGDILIWDIDKTYLDTQFSSLKGLLSIPFELAVDKRTLPGTVPLLRALRRGAGQTSALVPLYFVSGSPPQLRSVIEKKMTLDGVDFDGITFKDQWGLLKARRYKQVKAQVGYKITALLSYRRELPHGARWMMFGDDVESDATVFKLFGQICGGLRGGTLYDELGGLGVLPDDAQRIAGIADLIPDGPDPVERIFINLENKTRPDAFTDPRIVPTQSFLQSALVLAQLGRIEPRAISSVAADLRARHVPEAVIMQQTVDAQIRLGVDDQFIERTRR